MPNNNQLNIQHLNSVNAELQEAKKQLRIRKRVVEEIKGNEELHSLIIKTKQNQNVWKLKKIDEATTVTKRNKAIRDYFVKTLTEFCSELADKLSKELDREEINYPSPNSFEWFQKNQHWHLAFFYIVSSKSQEINWNPLNQIVWDAEAKVNKLKDEKLQAKILQITEESNLNFHKSKFFRTLDQIKKRGEMRELKEDFINAAKGENGKEKQWWRFKYIKGLTKQEENKINGAENLKKFEEICQEIEGKRSFGGTLFLLVFLPFIFFGWDKFWAWYEKPVKQEWDWEEDDEGEEKLVEVKGEEEPSAKPIPQKGWKRFKNLVLNNKVKTSCLLGIIICLIVLIWQGWNLYRA